MPTESRQADFIDDSGHLRQHQDIDGVPTVTVVIPFYNVEDCIGDCLRSVTGQEYANLEILLVDDASPDGSRSVAAAFAARDSRIRILAHDENRGAGPARNTGARHATGAYLLFLDSDDVLSSPRSVTRLLAEARSSGCRIVVGGCDRLLADGSHVPYDGEHDSDFDTHSNGVVRDVDAFLAAIRAPGAPYLPLRAWGALIQMPFYDALSLDFPAADHEDIGHTPFLYYLAGSVLYLREVVVSYRFRTHSVSNSPWSGSMIRRHVKLWQSMRANIERCGLQMYLGDTAMKVAEHMVWKLCENGFEPEATDDAIAVLEFILADAREITNMPLFRGAMDHISKFCGLSPHGLRRYRRLTGAMPREALLAYEADIDGNRHLARETELQNALRDQQERADQADARYQAMLRSTSWRATGPIRRLAHRFPTLRSYAGAVLAPLYRAAVRFGVVIHPDVEPRRSRDRDRDRDRLNEGL